MIPETAIVRQSPHAAYRDTQEGGVLLNLETGSYHGFNSIGALIWSLIDGQTVGELTDATRAAVSDAPADLGDDVSSFLEDLATRDLIEIDTTAE
ncbi:MAG: PqqD family protein [Actinobacteria bacterium]|nr:PqqD family protein [Actinomycetota bacterium]